MIARWTREERCRASLLGALLAVVVVALAPIALELCVDDRREVPRVPNPWFYLERAYPLGAIPREQWRLAQTQAAAMKQAAALAQAANSNSSTWIQRGPKNIGGRITDIAVHPLDDDIVYAGAAEGGVLRSADGGQTWIPLFDDQPMISIGAIAIDPSDPSVIYAGTGEVNPGGGSVAYGGAGLFRSSDEGATWEHLGLAESGAIGRIRIDPTDSDRVFVAVMGYLWDTNAERGVYRTSNGGRTWERVLFVDAETGCVDLIMRPDDPDVLYAAMWERLRQPEYYDYGGAGCAVYRSENGGDTWTLTGGGLPAPGADGGRIGLTLCSAQPDVMHAIYADRVGYFDGLYRSVDGGFNWSRTNDGALANVFASFGWWFGNVRTHPFDPDEIFVLGLNFYRSTDGGLSYFESGDSMHVDHHALEFGSGLDPVLYAGNDGGVYRSTTAGATWNKLPDLPVTQAYRIALDANNPDACYVGAQDNGTLRTESGADDDWEHIFGGDGFQPLVHPNDSDRIWAEYQYGGLSYSDNGGGSWSGATSGVASEDRHNWNTPVIQDPTDDDRRYYGSNRLYRSTGNTSWAVVSPDLTGGPHIQNGQVNGTITTAAVSPLDADVIWTGSDDGEVHVTTNGGGAWSDVSASLPVRWITSVRADPFVRESAYVTISGFRWSEPLPHVFRTSDLGVTWEPIAGNLPEAPINDLVVDPLRRNRLFVASDVGLFETRNGGSTWGSYGQGLPNVVVTSLALNPVDQLLFAGTYGRSVFSIGINLVACPADLTGDQFVGFDDLILLLAAWGLNPGHPADFDGDGVVGFNDLLVTLGAWGACG